MVSTQVKFSFNTIYHNRNHDNLPSLLSSPISVGSVPVSILLATLKLYISTWIPSSVGIGPVSLLLSMSKNASSATKQQQQQQQQQQRELASAKTRHVKQKDEDVLDHRLTKFRRTHPFRNGSCYRIIS